MLNETYANWLVAWIKNGTVNIKTGLPFTLNDIKSQEYKEEVISKLAEQ